MIRITSDINKTKRQLKAWKKRRDQDIIKQVATSAYDIEARAKRNVAVFEGHLRASINTKFIHNRFAAQIGSGVLTGQALAHAEAIEFGRKPGGFPPYKENTSLYRWVKLKLGIGGKMTKSVAFLIARKIAKYGFKKQPYLIPAYNSVRRDFEMKIKKLMRRG